MCQITSNEEMQFFLVFAIFDNVGRLTHQSVRIPLRSYLRIRLSVLPIAHIYLSVPSVSALPSIRPSSPSVHLSTSTRPSRVTHRTACVRAYLSNLSVNLYYLSPRAFSRAFTHSFLLSHFTYLFIYPFAIVRLLPLRAPTWILHAASIDLSRARSTRSPLPRIPRESRGFPETRFSRADVG